MMQWIHALIIAKEEDTTITNTGGAARAAVVVETQSIDVLLLLRPEAEARVHAEIGNDIAQSRDMHLQLVDDGTPPLMSRRHHLWKRDAGDLTLSKRTASTVGVKVINPSRTKTHKKRWVAIHRY